MVVKSVWFDSRDIIYSTAFSGREEKGIKAVGRGVVDSEQSLLVDDVIIVLSRNRINVAFAFSRNLTTVA